MIWQNFSEIRNDLKELRNQASGLGLEMKNAAERLQSGGVGPTADLMSELESYRSSFQQLTSLLGNTASIENSRMEQINSIDALEELVDEQESQQKTLDVVDSVLSINHSEDDNFEPLKQLQNGASDLRSMIAKGDAMISENDLQRRLDDYQALIDMVSKSTDMSDEEWDKAFDRITTTFGRSLSTAVVRGKLSMDVMAK